MLDNRSFIAAFAALTALTALPHPAAAQSSAKSPREAAVRYLDALIGKDANGRELSFGGKTMAIELEQLDNYEIIGEPEIKRERATLAELQASVARLDKAGTTGGQKALKRAGHGKDDLHVVELSTEDAQEITNLTDRESKVILTKYPVFAKISRVGRNQYWHPKNPVRALLKAAGSKGDYDIDLHTYTIEVKEGPRQVPRQWHLKVFRFRGGSADTGYKILAAADWAAD